MDEEFPDYHKLLDDMATEATLVTLRYLLALAATLSASCLKHSRALPTEGEGEFEKTGASGSGIHRTANTLGPAYPSLLLP